MMLRTTLAAVALAATASLTLAATPPAPKVKTAPAPPSPAAAPAPATSPAAAATPAAPAAVVVVKTVEPIHALVVPMKGSYAQHMDAFMQLIEQLSGKGKSPIGPPFARYFNHMGEVPEAELSWEVGFPVDPDVKATAPLEIKDVLGGLTATMAYSGPTEGLAAAGPPFAAWIAANGYRPSGPAMMVFVGEPDPTNMQVEMRQQVEKVK
jgi:effector-binding domain-containing protein